MSHRYNGVDDCGCFPIVNTALIPPGMSQPHAQTSQHVTQLLDQVGRGRSAAVNDLLPLVYDELRALASSFFRGQRGDHTLQPTALVHEAYARMVKLPAASAEAADAPAGTPGGPQGTSPWNSRAHFFAVAATAMRQILANHARDRRAAKRGGEWHRVTLSEAVVPAPAGGSRDYDLLTLDEALAALAGLDERQARIVELRFFSDMTVEEISHVMAVSVSTVEREWRMARAWLSGRLRQEDPA